ncbi:MAG: UDP-N-acetylmuramoyl-L-alanyl-D-glutamate--2,6-diaminopimelate ligase [Chloroflexi bacterium]|nr:UDP-N-acetylmuramoyl-L-alanyl-D-glutamate--2,6-diaminopimelate ligase [Chloroflexota bacterium]
MFSLGEIARWLAGPAAAPSPDLLVRRVVVDSRAVAPGDLFVAVRGVGVDAHRFVPDAFARGAVAAVVEDPRALPPGQVGLVVPDARRALAEIAAGWRGHPSRRLTLIGITGTDGKTTTASMVDALLRAAGRQVGLVTTVGARIAGQEIDTGLHTTTPDALAVQRLLAEMVAAGCTDAILETTSHALDQRRVHACEYDIAVVTNITPEHLDYHRTFEQYRRAKRRLFEMLATSYRKPGVPKVAVVNADDSASADFATVRADRVIRYGVSEQADVRAARIELTADRVHFIARSRQWERPITLAIPGRYNVANALAALAVGWSQEIPPDLMAATLGTFRGVEGRMEVIDLGQPFRVVVDFAHTPNSLAEALAALRHQTDGRLFVVFGCAGLRDRQKRPLMGEIAGRQADRIVLTAEDPRTEDVDAIIDEIAVGVERAGRRLGRDYWRVPDRAEAISFALARAEAGDLVAVTGKGHERSMCYGDEERPWSDQEAIRHSSMAGEPPVLAWHQRDEGAALGEEGAHRGQLLAVGDGDAGRTTDAVRIGQLARRVGEGEERVRSECGPAEVRRLDPIRVAVVRPRLVDAPLPLLVGRRPSQHRRPDGAGRRELDAAHPVLLANPQPQEHPVVHQGDGVARRPPGDREGNQQ